MADQLHREGGEKGVINNLQRLTSRHPCLPATPHCPKLHSHPKTVPPAWGTGAQNINWSMFQVQAPFVCLNLVLTNFNFICISHFMRWYTFGLFGSIKKNTRIIFVGCASRGGPDRKQKYSLLTIFFKFLNTLLIVSKGFYFSLSIQMLLWTKSLILEETSEAQEREVLPCCSTQRTWCCQIEFCWNKENRCCLLRGFAIKWKILGMPCQFHWRLKDKLRALWLP